MCYWMILYEICDMLMMLTLSHTQSRICNKLNIFSDTCKAFGLNKFNRQKKRYVLTPGAFYEEPNFFVNGQ